MFHVEHLAPVGLQEGNRTMSQLPQTAVNAAIVAAMLEHPRRDADRWGYVGCDMTPVVLDVGPAVNTYGSNDVWWVLVQYSTTGALASYGVDRNNIPQCYTD